MSWDCLIEAELVSIKTSIANRCVELSVSDHQDNNWVVCADGVDDFLVSEMRLTNIIDKTVLVGGQEDVSDSVKERVYYLMRGEFPVARDFDWAPFREKIKSIQRGELFFFEMVPVYGAHVIVIAERVSLVGVK